ncbi:rhodanese-like domain-containing protein [Robiginitalea sp. M366]|uniref:rhodanese-like domain-containing protein n=1 Tax=Robiginitalea aestuariiviva TaxID=3036903 RepID=UPI00240D2DE9|nr:rhodanese-like domain-containing protein [Robiginitalea aestuariiviva]MDG1572070.1 rhodanese-like domain-containing protein [Robiginitalea aestuariiviva]
MKKLWMVWLALGMAVACSQPPSGKMPITEFDPQAMPENAVLVDVRTPEEFGEGHLDGAQNINWMSPEFANQWQDISKDRTVYVYCKVGGRSAKAAHFLDSLGYNVVDLTGGWDAYKAAQ